MVVCCMLAVFFIIFLRYHNFINQIFKLNNMNEIHKYSNDGGFNISNDFIDKFRKIILSEYPNETNYDEDDEIDDYERMSYISFYSEKIICMLSLRPSTDFKGSLISFFLGIYENNSKTTDIAGKQNIEYHLKHNYFLEYRIRNISDFESFISNICFNR